MNEKMKCVCGHVLHRSQLEKHLESKEHTQYMSKHYLTVMSHGKEIKMPIHTLLPGFKF